MTLHYTYMTWCIIHYHSDILHLNKQRVMAIEELDAMKREKKSYLEKIEQLEVEKQANSKKGDTTEFLFSDTADALVHDS